MVSTAVITVRPGQELHPYRLPRLPEEFRRRWVRLTTLGEAKAGCGPAFVKPPNDKCFPARVYANPTELPQGFPAETPVLVAEVVEWEMEFRCFLLDRTVRTYSVYLRNGQLQSEQGFASTDAEDTEMLRFVAGVLADTRVELPRAAVLDVGVLRGRGWAVVEQNAAWGSGLYGCDPMEVLQVLRHAGEVVA